MQNATNRKRVGFLLVIFMFGAAAVAAVAGSQSSSPSSEQAGAGADKMDSAAQSAVDIVRDPSDVAPPVGNRQPQLVKVTLVAQELEGKLDPSAGSTYKPQEPGIYKLTDHALIRIARGLVAVIDVTGPANPELFHAGPAQ